MTWPTRIAGTFIVLTGLMLALAGCGGQSSEESTPRTQVNPGSAPKSGAAHPGQDAVDIHAGNQSPDSGNHETGSPQPSDYLDDVRQRLIPFGAERRQQMAEYSLRHYGKREWRLRRPTQIVEHFAVAPSNDAIFNTFSSNQPDPSFGELPNVCAHFAVDDSGKVIQMVGLGTRCRHTVGLNATTVGIEHVGFADEDVLNNPIQMKASLKLTQALRCRYGIPVRDVIGHNESLESRFHTERVPQFQGQTHGDFASASMDLYRQQLRRLGPC